MLAIFDVETTSRVSLIARMKSIAVLGKPVMAVSSTADLNSSRAAATPLVASSTETTMTPSPLRPLSHAVRHTW